MNEKKVFLLETAYALEMKESVGCYDSHREINLKLDPERSPSPVVSLDMAPPTESKTMAAPGDDDPDPEDERCY